MVVSNGSPSTRSYDSLLFDIESLNQHPDISSLASAYLDGDYKTILHNPDSQGLFKKLAQSLHLPIQEQKSIFSDGTFSDATSSLRVSIIGLAAFNVFLQLNVTGPQSDFGKYFPEDEDGSEIREKCLSSLEVDGVSVYQYIPGIGLFCLARMIFMLYFPRIVDSAFTDCKWMRIRINAFHQRLLSGLPGGRLSDSTLLQGLIEKDLKEFEDEILGTNSSFSTDAKVQFLLEKAQIYILQGLDVKARENINMAKTMSGFSYALSGALGKRTKYQQTDISQLVVYAKSNEPGSTDEVQGSQGNGLQSLSHPENGKEKSITNGLTDLDLNDDTLLESIAFTKVEPEKVDHSGLPPELAGMQPDQQPQLKPLDQIILLTEATIKDTFSPLDKLNSEEILPYAVRVLTDEPTNWQIYTQALLVRSRIESHRSRTQERSVLQLQVIVDQVIADTQQEASSPDGIPQIQVTQFLPRATASESAPVVERLKYIYPLNGPTRWEIETELADAWSSAGSFINALEIFKRLRLWAEVALCYHSAGQEDKARQVVRRQLYYSSKGKQMDGYNIDAAEIQTEKWEGEMRSPSPPHSPRLWCILGDLDQDPSCWQRAWEISKKRYARARRSLGEYYTKQGNLEAAREAYVQATIVNRQNNETWSRLGDIDLRVGNWDGAVVAFQQSIMIDDGDAKTYSNLGSALLSKYSELVSVEKSAGKGGSIDVVSEEGDEDVENGITKSEAQPLPKEILHQALLAYKRGASIAHDNWKIWDNVITIAFRMSPPSYADIIMAMRSVIRIRGPSIGENCVDIDILRALVMHIISFEIPKAEEKDDEGGNRKIYEPPRGSLTRAVIQMVEGEIIPLITRRAEFWMLVEKLALWRRDFKGALKAAEKGWRVLYSGEVWAEEEEKWKEVVSATERLVGAYENYGVREIDGKGEVVEKSWRGKARSAVRGVMGKERDVWEGSEGWIVLEELLEELRGS